jgi:Holliday junction resolvase RusA-like endonuclease
MSFFLPVPDRRHALLARQAPACHVSKPDIDNLVKSTLDALTGSGYWLDDSLVVDAVLRKRYATALIPPGADIEVFRILELEA